MLVGLLQAYYHHHLAVDEWGGKDLAKREEDMLGLAYYVLEVEDKGDLIAIAERANNTGAEVNGYLLMP